MKQSLLAGDIDGAVPYFATATADKYREAFRSIGTTQLPVMMGQIPALTPALIDGDRAQYFFNQTIGGIVITYPVEFIKENGKWKIMEY